MNNDKPSYLSVGYAAETKGMGVDIHPEFLNGLKENSLILDIGCGAGNHAREFARRGHNVYACDPGIGTTGSPTASCIKDTSGGSVTFFNATAETFSKELKEQKGEGISNPRHFDGIWMQYSLPFVKDIPSAMSSISEHLKTGGVLYTSFFEQNDEQNQNPQHKPVGFFPHKPKEIAVLLQKNELPLNIEFCQLLPPPRPKRVESPNGNVTFEVSGIQNPATILILEKKDNFEQNMNLTPEGVLKAEKIGSHTEETSWVDRTSRDSHRSSDNVTPNGNREV